VCVCVCVCVRVCTLTRAHLHESAITMHVCVCAFPHRQPIEYGHNPECMQEGAEPEAAPCTELLNTLVSIGILTLTLGQIPLLEPGQRSGLLLALRVLVRV
jgi:hypothetical protein